MRAVAEFFRFRAIWAGMTVLAVMGGSSAPAARIFVAGSDPNASDENPGAETRPFKTIQKAATLARAGDTVLIRAGTYRETVTPARSGSNGAPITYMPYNNEKVVIDGAEPVTNWTKHSGSIYRAAMHWSVDHGNGDQVFVDGRMMNYARHPNSSLDVSNPTRITADTGTHVPASPAFLQPCSGVYTSTALNDFPDSKLDPKWVGATIHFELMGQGYVETGMVSGTSPGSVTFNYAASTYNTIRHNTIYNSARSLILIRNFGSGLIVHNDLYNAMLQSLDGGAIYTYNQNGKAFNSSHPNTRIAYNRIHNIHTTYDKLDVGIYIDNNSPNYVLDHNLIYDVWLPIYLNADSRNNTVCNNTLYATVFGTACLQACGDGTGTLLANNIYCSRTYMPGTNYTSSHNLDEKVDPLFVDPAALDFRLQPGSRAKSAGKAMAPCTDGFVGSAPDIGAFQCGVAPWTAGASAATNPYMRNIPATPTRLTAAAAGSAVTLAWRGDAHNATSYVLEGSADDLGFTPVATLPARSTSYTDPAAIYRYYRVCAVNGYYRSGYSNFARSSQTSAATAIAAWTHSAASNPAGANWWDFWLDSHNWVKYSGVSFDACLNKVHVMYATDAGNKYAGNRIEFRLDKPTGPIIGHVVSQSTGGWNKFVTASGIVSGVTGGVHDLYITCSPPSAPWPAVALHSFRFSDTAGLAVPSQLVATAASGGTVNLSWTARSTNHAGFKIERSTEPQAFVEIGTADANARAYRDAAAPPNATCYYRLRAYNQSSGNSGYSNIAAYSSKNRK